MTYNDEPREKLNKLEKKLYSRSAPNIMDEGRTNLSQGEEWQSSGWEDIKKNNFDSIMSKFSQTAEKKKGVVSKIFYGSLIFFILAALVAFFVFLGGVNSVSSRNVDIRVSGPLSVAAGQEVKINLNVVNNNNVDLNSAVLLLEYPTGTRAPENLEKELERQKFEFGTIKKGESKIQNLDLVFFGEKESVKKIKISLEYRVENSSALFLKDKEYELLISSSPVIVTAIYPKEVNSNQSMDFEVEVASNSKERIQAFLLSIEYPFGFVFESASPSPDFGNNTWRLPNLSPNEKRVIRISGKISGQDNEERTFRVNAGTPNSDDERQIGVSFTELTESIMVKRPFLGLDFYLAGVNGDAAVRGGSRVNSEIVIKNNLPSRLFNTTVEVALSGGAFDRASVNASSGGFFQSFNDTILWDRRSVSKLNDISPGDTVNLSFQLAPLVYSSIPSGIKPEINLVLKIKGERASESGRVEEIVITENRKISLSTDLVLASKTVRSLGNIENYGPIPPKVEQKTSYTIHWRLDNTFNQVSNVEVKAVLPPYVKFTGQVNPSQEKVSYNETTKEITWNVGTILPYVGINSPARDVYFQLELLPSISQVGETPMILGETKLSGIDKVLGQKIQSSIPGNSINFYTDSTFSEGYDKVTQ